MVANRPAGESKWFTPFISSSNVDASKNKGNVNPAINEALLFAEIDSNKNIQLSFKLGKNLNQLLTSFQFENTDIKTTANEIASYFNKEVTQQKYLDFIFEKLGVEELSTRVNRYLAPLSSSTIEYLNNYKTPEDFRIHVFIKPNQEEAGLESGELDFRSFKVLKPESNDIFIWLVSRDGIKYDRNFVIVKIGLNVAKAIRDKKFLKEDVSKMILEAIDEETDQNIFSQTSINRGITKTLPNAMAELSIQERIEKDPAAKKLFQENPTLFLTIESARFATAKLESLKFQPNNWDPRIKPYRPFIDGDTKTNAFICGLIDGFITEIQSIPEMIEFFGKLQSDPKAFEEFINTFYELIVSREIFEIFFKQAIQGYEEAFKENNVEKLYYTVGSDVIQIISLLVGIYKLASSVPKFANFTKNAIIYIQRNGRKGIDDLKKLNNKKVKEVFDEIDNEFNPKIEDYYKRFKKANKELREIPWSDIIRQIKNVTPQATILSRAFKKGIIGKKILDDFSFEQYVKVFSRGEISGENVSAFAYDKILYFRESTPVESFFNEIIHEGTHAVDEINGLFNDTVRLYNETAEIIHQGEKVEKYIRDLTDNQIIEFRARIFEREFQIATNQETDFESIKSLVKYLKETAEYK